MSINTSPAIETPPSSETRSRIASILKQPNPDKVESVKETAQANFRAWNEALQTRDAATVAKMYSEDCTFLPTQSGEFKQGQSGAEDYFHHFLQKNPEGRIVEERVQELGPDSYLHSGMYNFEVGPKDNRSIVEARFTYVWKRDDEGNWKIAHHHSSVKPKPSN